MANSDIHYFGIRHHGPGSSKRLLDALDALQPTTVLIEGPQDCSNILSLLAHQHMKPPVALLAYDQAKPEQSIYFPFADYSPEYQACCWSVRQQAQLQFIDLPVGVRLASMDTATEQQTGPEDTAAAPNKTDSTRQETDDAFYHDPIGALAQLAGYEEGESWWNDWFEQNNTHHEALFAAIESAMTALREQSESKAEHDEKQTEPQCHTHSKQWNLMREAFMRLEIIKAAKHSQGPVAVICGAWHIPALKTKHTQKNDRLLLKPLPPKLPKSRVKATWIPWTSPRLASQSGYGAGVDAPMWYQHLWEQRHSSDALAHWLSKVTQTLRAAGQVISTASVIEALRLAHGLASIRGRPSPGFEEMRDASIASLCFGEALIWKQHEPSLLLGNRVGKIPDEAPLAPLLEDLQRLQKQARLKPEALAKDISVDLRSQAGLLKSSLLHRLNALDVDWGHCHHISGRGTFRENWTLKWEPEFAVQLVENLVYGSTIEQAANNRLIERLKEDHTLGELAQCVQQCIDARLERATQTGLQRIEARSAQTDHCQELLTSLPPLVTISRYGTARNISQTHIDQLIERLTIQAALSLPYASRGVNDEEAQHFHNCLQQAHSTILLAELDKTLTQRWWHALLETVDLANTHPLLAGLCARLLYQGESYDAEQIQQVLERMLSPAVNSMDAAHFFDGFFSDASQHLLYDSILRQAIEQWLLGLDEENFIQHLPLFRRVFADLDGMERKRLLDAVLNQRSQQPLDFVFNETQQVAWDDQQARLLLLTQRKPSWRQGPTS